ncbi:hypothetical protein FLAN108750_02930 [Flavobacterium antarcticum]|uniref:hypothetical protein n=1 Tax=Flavobacterium antarcticum TaxID=271155 RepID=UPI0003B3B4E8|nr:hypothetical protein [Flavobacterium antarcticum]
MKRIFILLIVLPLLSFNSDSNAVNITAIDLIGKWTGEDKGEIGFITFDKEGYASFEIQGQIIGGKEFVMNGKKGKMTYEFNLEKKPIEIDMTITKLEFNEQKKILCIAEFEDENTMIFALTFDSERPTEFNDENSIKLKRTE